MKLRLFSYPHCEYVSKKLFFCSEKRGCWGKGTPYFHHLAPLRGVFLKAVIICIVFTGFNDEAGAADLGVSDQTSRNSKVPASSIAVTGHEFKPWIFLTPAEVKTFREQATNPELVATYATLVSSVNTDVEKWRHDHPLTPERRSTEDLIELGRTNGGSAPKSIAVAYILHPDPNLGEVLREKLISMIGARQKNNYWRTGGISEGGALLDFLEAYEIAEGSGLLTVEDRKVIKEEMRRCAHHLEGWTLDNDISIAAWSDPHVYCLNYEASSSSGMGLIAMVFPDLPESKEWLSDSQKAISGILFRENGLDGGYGEGCLHYWHPSFGMIQAFMIASRNLGYRDYISDPAFAEVMKNSFNWRKNATAPDGHLFAVGDSDRSTIGAELLGQAGEIYQDPGFTWVSREIMKRSRGGIVPGEPYDLFHIDLKSLSLPPAELSTNLADSGYAYFRSGWGAQDNFFLLKYGTTYIGRRERERNRIITGHAHADALEFELHHKGIPIAVDPGRVGIYQNFDTYGGFCKATISHNTVGLGNIWGYDRLDGLYDEHVKEHGPGFLYERGQDDIGRADRRLTAYGDLGDFAIISAKLKTYADVTHHRTVVWFRKTSVTVISDRMDSSSVQPYEWYLSPIGSLLNRGKDDSVLTFGDEMARLDVIPMLPKNPKIQIISRNDPKVPHYYVTLRPAGEMYQMSSMGKNIEPKDRTGKITLLVIKKDAKTTDFLNVLIPYEKTSPYALSAMGTNGIKLSAPDSTLLVSGGSNKDSGLGVDGVFGVASIDHGVFSNYILQKGHSLSLGKDSLVKAELIAKEWEPFFDSAITAAVSLKDKRATFGVAENPMNEGLIVKPPRIDPGKPPEIPIQVSVTFRTETKPTRIITFRSETTRPEINDPEMERKTTAWPRDYHAPTYKRKTAEFTWDEASKSVTLPLEVGITQAVWE